MKIKSEMEKITKRLTELYPDKHIHIYANSLAYWYEGKCEFVFEYGLYVEEEINHGKFKSLTGMGAFINAKHSDEAGDPEETEDEDAD